ncbi:MAG: acyl-CoA dehydrogenase family protein [Dehalococcoidia bacterium]|nr:acyl-CoA dehydrogenase family protein [Dehalococcoidia bacterium]
MAFPQHDLNYYFDTAHELAEKVAANADQIDIDRQIPTELTDELADKGFFRLLLPKSLGGAQLAHSDFLKILEIFAAEDGSTAWCINQNNVFSTNSLRMPLGIAEEIYAEARAVVTNGPPDSSARAVPCDGGYKLSGRWNFSSGITHASWIAALAPVLPADQEPSAVFVRESGRVMLIPKNDVKFVDFWPVHGLRGTASFSFEVEDLFIPEERTYSPTNQPRKDGPVYGIPITLLFASGFSTVALGIAQASLGTAMDLAEIKIPGRASRLLQDEPTTQRIIGEAQAIWHSAKAFLREAHASLWESASANKPLTVEQRIKLRLAATFGIRKSKEIVEIAYELCGSNAILDTNPIQRQFQDIHVVSQHIQGRATHFETAGQFFMGLDPQGNF